ncbi:DUF3107 domain-containing protein [Brachybacterium sp. AOP25-B2-12]|uniref:DUF3107 domain-containing protein n=1 Tax=Brachybacterium sp. AOP25-B2-12 TaxID=3457710 RepID=UPI004034D302
MEIRIGVQHSPREIVIETESSSEELTAAVAAAIDKDESLTLTDAKGRVVIVPGAKIAYAELATEEPRRVGFLG